MSTLNRNNRGDAIRETINQRAGLDPDADAIAQSTLITWQQISAQLEPVIGARGVDALFTRSMHLVGNTHHWLEANGVRKDGAVSPASIRICFEGREPPVVTDAACALLATFTDLLANLIGESLTARLLETVWLQLPPDNPKEPAPCATK